MSDSNRMSSILTAVKVVFTVVTVLLVWFLSYYINIEIVIVFLLQHLFVRSKIFIFALRTLPDGVSCGKFDVHHPSVVPL